MKNTYGLLNDSIMTSSKDEMKIIVNEEISIYFMWNKDKKLILEDSKSEDSDVFNFINVKQTPICISTSGDLAYFSTVVGKVKMSGYWCHWRN